MYVHPVTWDLSQLMVGANYCPASIYFFLHLSERPRSPRDWKSLLNNSFHLGVAFRSPIVSLFHSLGYTSRRFYLWLPWNTVLCWLDYTTVRSCTRLWVPTHAGSCTLRYNVCVEPRVIADNIYTLKLRSRYTDRSAKTIRVYFKAPAHYFFICIDRDC